MRDAFVKAVEENIDKNTVLITGDLGFGVLKNFIAKYPKQYLNAGVAEQNLTSIAAGMALEGKKVITYSIANFNTLRALEQIRNDIAYHELNVIIVSIGGGLAYGQLGISHHATEDIAIMRTIPNLKVFAPGDTVEAYHITKILLEENLGPVYLRIGRAGEATIHTMESIKTFEFGRPLKIRNGTNNEIAILSTGGMLETACLVAFSLEKLNLESSVYSFPTLKPINETDVFHIFTKYKYVFSMEEHTIIGGFASILLESLLGKGSIDLAKFYPFSLPPAFTSIVGDQNYLRDYFNLSPKKILNKILLIINKI